MSDYVDIHSIFLKFIPFWELKINVTQQNISQMVFLCPSLKRSKTELHFPKDTAISRIHGCNPDRLLELNYYFCANTSHYNVAFPKDKKDWELRFLLMNRTQQSLFLSGFKKHQLSRAKLPAQHSGQSARWDEDLGSQYHLPRGVIHRLQQVKMLRKATVDRARNGQQ